MSWVETILSSSGIASMLSGLLEGMGIPWPGALVLTAAGAKAANPSAAVTLALCFSILYTASSWVQYALGRYCWRFLQRYVPKKQQESLYAVMQRYGELAVLWTRPLAIGNYVSLPAGITGMRPTKFLFYTFLGILPWSLTMAFGGSLIGAYLSSAADLLPTAAILMAVFGLFATTRKVIRTRKASHVNETENRVDAFAD